jgi:hypothetical protein
MSRASGLAGFSTSISPPSNLSVGVITVFHHHPIITLEEQSQLLLVRPFTPLQVLVLLRLLVVVLVMLSTLWLLVAALVVVM